MEGIDAVKRILEKIYGAERGRLAFERIVALMKKFPVKAGQGKGYFSEKDVFLITYGDTLNQKGEVPLRTLHKFAGKQFKDVFSTIHILPFFPFSSDDGFSVMDFFTVNPELGVWEDLKPLGENFKLMFDLVLNHVSAQSTWFQNYLEEVPGFEDLAIEVDPATDLYLVTRPRSLPLLTEFEKSSGKTVHVWTTFSADQIDLNFKSLDVLLKMIEVLLFYVKQGATSIRLDAIAYLWKEIGTTCIHLSSTHEIVKLFRSILDVAAPEVILITETNVPHQENISYFGSGRNEAQMVYNFTLSPLLFYTFVKEDATVLSDWAKGLHLTCGGNTFFNFTASHDGIGVRPLEGILPQAEIDKLIQTVKANGGRVSYKKNTDGSESPYELNITYVDAFWNKAFETDPLHAKRFLASQSIQYALPGVPATYIHSILGSRNWQEGVRQTQRARTINREKLQVDSILSQLKDPETFRSRIFYPYIELIKIRRKQPALHPNASFEVLEIDPKVFGIARYCKEQTIYALTNLSSQHVVVTLKGKGIPARMKNLFSGKECGTDSLRMDPYEYLWLSSN
ncbi:MAG: alpha-amylase family glycosyl hydrolase [Candidatus Desulfatibia sp.]|uniref:alpha-amylase family glycosyl hydrolase n=1 Tax=Candidatus Desulfatibia sp. TaxID=3101189 RepID=UPI002F343AAB